MSTVRELLQGRDVGKLAEIYMTRRDYYDGLDMPTIENVDAGMTRFIEEFSNLESKDCSEYIIVPSYRSEDDERHLVSDMYKIEDLKRYEIVDESTLIEIERNAAQADVEWLQDRMCEISCTSQNIYRYGYSWCDWSEIVEVLVFDRDLDEERRDIFAEDVLWELTWNGIDKESHDERVEELEEMLSERIESIQSVETHTGCSIDELYEKLGVPRKSEKEKALDRLKMYRVMLRDIIDEARILTRCKAWLEESVL